jgi:uncharacterized protein
MFFMSDPIYMVVMGVGSLLVFLPQMWVKKTVESYSQVPASRGFSGAQVAEALLRENQVYDVGVEMVEGVLSDHYDPSAKKVRLSRDNYFGQTVSGVAIAAHEVGHAIQHATGYYPIVVRGALAPVVNIGSQLGPMLFFVSIGITASGALMPDWAWALAWLGVLLFGTAVVFHIITLPVEINASMRALKIISGSHYLTETELPGAKKVLTAAAFTYVAAALYSLIQLLYFVFRLLNSRRSE